MSQAPLPPCGLYRTTAEIAGVPAGRLIYFHNHGDPGPGMYLPDRWNHNRAHFAARGTTAPADFDGAGLHPLPREGFYRVGSPFHCCAKQCVKFEPDAMVQLGYNGAGQAILFQPELRSGALTIPDRGSLVDDAVLAQLVALTVREVEGGTTGATGAGGLGPFPRGIVIH